MSTKPVKRKKRSMKGDFREEGDVYVYLPEQRIVRFMFDDGTTADVRTPRDDSDMRNALLVALDKEKIVGTAYLGMEDASV